MALNRTNLVLAGAPLPQDFRGTVQELFEEMIRRLSILSPVGTNFFVISDVEPSSDVGPWLKGGTQWWVFDITTGRYIPADISASLPLPFFAQDADPGAPEGNEPLVWLRTSQDRIIGLYGWDGTQWVASGNIVHSGPTANRPSVPVDLENYFDTDINVAIRWERGAWRTESGSPGDVKSVTHTVLTEALRHNPGWAVLGADDQSQRGRFIGMAAKDPGTSPVSAFTTDSGITAKAAGEQAGSERVQLTSLQIEQHTHEIGHALANAADQRWTMHREDNGDTLLTPEPHPPNFFRTNPVVGLGGAIAGDPVSGFSGDAGTGAALITSKQFTEANAAAYTEPAQSHDNTPASMFLWTLVKQ